MTAPDFGIGARAHGNAVAAELAKLDRDDEAVAKARAWLNRQAARRARDTERYTDDFDNWAG